MSGKQGSTKVLTASDGRELAVNMLVEMEELGLDELAIEGNVELADEVRDGRPQSDILLRYLRVAQQHPEVEAGFLAILTDALGSSVEGGGAIELYEQIARTA